MMVLTTLPNHFAVELVGGRRINRELKVVKRRLDDPEIFFGQFQHPADAAKGIVLSGGCVDANGLVRAGGIVDLAVITAAARQELDRRFPGIAELYPSAMYLVSSDGAPSGSALSFCDDANYVHIENALLANSFEGIVRIRHIRLALIVRKDTDINQYEGYLENLLSISHGSRLVAACLIPGAKAEIILRAAQFANIFLMNKLHETSIGTFISQHREILLSALEAKNLVSEPYLPWVVRSPDPSESAINPDLFVQRADGFWDVYDLKLALLGRKSLTVGRRRRRRFVTTIEDGIAQLAHYRDFLSIPEHAVAAKEKYNVEFRNPKYVLVVGNYENVEVEKVVEARRRFPDLEIIDYDSLLQLYLIHENALPKSSTTEGLIR